MRLPGLPSLIFLAYLLVFLPWAAHRSARRLRAALDGSVPPVSREGIWIGSTFALAVLFVLSWLVGRGFGFRIFEVGAIGGEDVPWTALALAALFALRAVAVALHRGDERRQRLIFLLVPRTRRETALWIVTVLAASVAEEAAYRGVGMAILWFTLGSPWPAAAISALAFALAHAAQGWKAGVVIYGIALVLHALVALTGTLVIAMVVHGVYDFAAGALIRRDAARSVSQ